MILGTSFRMRSGATDEKSGPKSAKRPLAQCEDKTQTAANSCKNVRFGSCDSKVFSNDAHGLGHDDKKMRALLVQPSLISTRFHDRHREAVSKNLTKRES